MNFYNYGRQPRKRDFSPLVKDSKAGCVLTQDVAYITFITLCIYIDIRKDYLKKITHFRLLNQNCSCIFYSSIEVMVVFHRS